MCMWCGSAGIGKSIAYKLARQGLNVVLAAYPDELLNSTFDDISSTFPKLKFRKVINLSADVPPAQLPTPADSLHTHVCLLGGVSISSAGTHVFAVLPHIPLPCLQVPVNLGKEGYLEDLAKATDDIRVQLVFNNAGYLLTGFFHTR